MSHYVDVAPVVVLAVRSSILYIILYIIRSPPFDTLL